MSNQSLTNRQQEVLDFLKETHRNEGFMPSTRDIQHHFNFASQTAAMSHLRALERKGVIVRKANKACGIGFPEEMEREEIVDIPIYGSIAAGMAQDVDGEKEGCLSIAHTRPQYCKVSGSPAKQLQSRQVPRSV